MKEIYFSIKEAAEILGVSSLTLRNWDKSGKFPAQRHPMNNYRVLTRVTPRNRLRNFSLNTRRIKEFL